MVGKKFHEASEGGLRDFRAEVTVLRKVRAKRTVLFMGACSQPGNTFVVMEAMRMSLYDYLHMLSHTPQPLSSPKDAKRW